MTSDEVCETIRKILDSMDLGEVKIDEVRPHGEHGYAALGYDEKDRVALAVGLSELSLLTMNEVVLRAQRMGNTFKYYSDAKHGKNIKRRLPDGTWGWNPKWLEDQES